MVLRYVLLPVLAGALATVVASILRAAFPRTDIGFELLQLPPVGVLCGWVAAVVSDRRRKAWRVWGPWAPCVPLLVLLIVSMLRPRAPWDDTGFDLLLYAGVLLYAVVFAGIGSVIAWAWRPDEGWVRPSQ